MSDAWMDLIQELRMGLFGPSLPPITIGEADRHDLLVLAMSGTGHSPDQADDLLYELGRAEVVDDRRLPPHVVRMGSGVIVSIDGAEPQLLRLAYPHERGAGDISVLSPVGTALLGLRSGQTMTWSDRDGNRQEIRIHSVCNHQA